MDQANTPGEGLEQMLTIIEMKTGYRPSFTRNQLDVYPAVTMGGELEFLDSKVLVLGVIPNHPLDRMQGFAVVVPGQNEDKHTHIAVPFP